MTLVQMITLAPVAIRHQNIGHRGSFVKHIVVGAKSGLTIRLTKWTEEQWCACEIHQYEDDIVLRTQEIEESVAIVMRCRMCTTLRNYQSDLYLPAFLRRPNALLILCKPTHIYKRTGKNRPSIEIARLHRSKAIPKSLPEREALQSSTLSALHDTTPHPAHSSCNHWTSPS